MYVSSLTGSAPSYKSASKMSSAIYTKVAIVFEDRLIVVCADVGWIKVARDEGSSGPW